MTPTETTNILRQFNAWRRGDEDIPQPDPREIGEAIDAAVEMIESAEEDRALCDKLAGILTRTANVLKGEPKPLHRHGWHDLPEVALRLVATAGQNTVNAMLAHSRKSGKQRSRKPLAKLDNLIGFHVDVATDLLRLLKEARSTLEMWKDVAPAVSLCADIDAAIAKATGEQP